MLGSAPVRADGERTWVQDDGSFRIDGVPPGAWFLTVCGREHGRAAAALVTRAGGEERVEVRLDPGLVAEGRVLDEHGAPLAGLSVSGPTARIPDHRLALLGGLVLSLIHI